MRSIKHTIQSNLGKMLRVAIVVIILALILPGCSERDHRLLTAELQALLDRSVSGDGVPGAVMAMETPNTVLKAARKSPTILDFC